MNPWLLLILAGIFEIAWAVALPAARGFTRPIPSVLVILAMALSFYLLSLATRALPVGVAYPVWVGIGAAGAFLAGSVILGEPVRWTQLLWITLLVVSIVGLKLSAGGPAGDAVAPGVIER